MATSYPGSARRFFNGHGCEPEIITLSGSAEVAPSLGLADAIVELTATGSTLLLNDLRPIATILESQAVLVANPEALADPVRRENIDQILMRIKAGRAARRYKYVMMNAPESALPAIRKVVPGLKSPTIVPLAEEGWFAVHTAIEEDTFGNRLNGCEKRARRRFSFPHSTNCYSDLDVQRGDQGDRPPAGRFNNI